MTERFVVAVLAGFGVLSVLWALFGWLLPVCRKGWLLCPGRKECLSLVWLYLWLRGMGIVKCPLIVVDYGLLPQERCRLTDKGIEICGLSELEDRLRMGEGELDRGNADHSGRDQRRGIPEL